MKSFNMINSLVSLKSEEIGDRYRLNDQSLDILRQYCDYIDEACTDFAGTGIEAEVNEDLSITISVLCPSVHTGSKWHPFVQLISRAILMQFQAVNENCVKISMVFPTLWES